MNQGTIALTGRALVLNEDFKIANLSGPGAFMGVDPDWYTGNPPWPFGQENWQTALTNPMSAPYSLDANGLSITATKNADGSWNSGLICSVSDSQGTHGFKVLPGDYIEATIKLPNDVGLWPSFWLNTCAPSGETDPTVEIDIFEVPNDNNVIWQTTVHTWQGGQEVPNTKMQATPLEPANEQFSDFHRYGVALDSDFLSFTLDGEIWERMPTPAAMIRPMGIIIALAFGGGFALPTDAGPLVMTVKSVQVWR